MPGDERNGDKAGEFSRAEVETFLHTENLKYQKIDLPFGLSTPGHPRRQAKDLAFEGDVRGKTVLDIGSFLGAFCIEALQRGASRAVGLELDRERLRQSKKMAQFLGLSPEYVRADVESWSSGRFDIILCLNVLHHLRNPLATLRTLSLCTQERLVIESATLRSNDSEKLGLNVPVCGRSKRVPFAERPAPLSEDETTIAQVLNGQPIAYIDAGSPSVRTQTFFFTEAGLRRILESHMRLFQRVEVIESEFKNRFLLRCTRLRFDRLVIAAGATGARLSQLSQQLLNESYGHVLKARVGGAHMVAAEDLWKLPAEACFPKPHYPAALFKYDIAMVLERYNAHSFQRDPALDLTFNSKSVDVVVAVPPANLLIEQIDTALTDRAADSAYLETCRLKYERPGFLKDLYSDWIEFCGGVNARIFLLTHDGQISQCSEQEALQRIQAIYS